MINAKRGFIFVGRRTYQMLKYSTMNLNYDGVTLNPKFTALQQQKILNTLNKSNREELSRFDITQGRIKNLESWRNKKGPFRSLNDILEVDGLGVKILEKLCNSIVADNNEKIVIKKPVTNSKSRRQYLTPALTSDEASMLSSAIGLHLGPTGVSWAKICRAANALDSWGYHDFTNLPKKLLPTDTFQLAITILDMIPKGEVYIFEAPYTVSPQSNKPAAVITSYTQQLELSAMLLALINTSASHNPIQPADDTSYENSVYHLRANLAARLFRTLMGTERVSSTNSVTKLLENSCIIDSTCPLPCTPVVVSQELQEQYYSQSPVFRELLGQALLLVVTFMDICVYKNPASLDAIAPGKRS